MKTADIQLGKSYEVSVGRGTTIVRVIEINYKTDTSWKCETQNGKEIIIGDAKRFIKVIDDGKGSKRKSQKGDKPASRDSSTRKKSPDTGGNQVSLPNPQAEPQAVPSPVAKPQRAKESEPVADTETLERLRKAVKDADKKLRTARHALQFGFIDQGKLDEATVEYDVACKALKDAGGKVGTGGRCLGQMSSRDAAYKVLCATGESMTGRQICEMALDLGYWEPQGETPEATMVSAMLTEMKKKGDAARFIRTGKGMFAARQ
jgi:hypothetical protein